jgi:hypothetical protein
MVLGIIKFLVVNGCANSRGFKTEIFFWLFD